MSRFSKDSIQRLRDVVDIVDIISRYVPLKRAGGSYKGLCPFHDEKTPSFTVHKASRHYHCFGCGAHGDAVTFLMQQERMSFSQAMQFLAERFGVNLEVEHDEKEEKGTPKRLLRELLEKASLFFQSYLLFSEEAGFARRYLEERSFSLEFLRSFGVGYAPKTPGLLRAFLSSQKFTDQQMQEAGLLSFHEGRFRDFFSERITFPILDSFGNTIGFSARKVREETYGGKYINTAETALFKKSRVLFGLFYSKKRIMKDRFICLVEGQLDALRLIHAGFDYAVATLGTAFGPPHVEQLKALGVEEVYLSFDQDDAGAVSAEKAGHLLLKSGLGVRIVNFQGAKDPDELIQKRGKKAFFDAMTASSEYVPFLIHRAKKNHNWMVPQEKDASIRMIVEKIREWNNPILVHESIKQLASLSSIPEGLIQNDRPQIKEPEVLPMPSEGPSLLELDLVRWLIFSGPDNKEVVQYCQQNICPDDFSSDIARQLFILALDHIQKGESVDFLHLAQEVDAEKLSDALDILLARRPRREKILPIAMESIRKIKERNWLLAREEIRKKMQEPGKSEDELLALAKEFDRLTKDRLSHEDANISKC
jgi:DNA primase